MQYNAPCDADDGPLCLDKTVQRAVLSVLLNSRFRRHMFIKPFFMHGLRDVIAGGIFCKRNHDILVGDREKRIVSKLVRALAYGVRVHIGGHRFFRSEV